MADGATAAVMEVRSPAGVWSRAEGSQDRLSDKPAQVGHKLRIASITKSFVATAVLKLVEEGVVGVDDPAEAHIPDFESLLHPPRAVTVRQLLSHTSGIADPWPGQARDMTFQESFAARFSHQDVLRLAGASPWHSGAKSFHYSDANYSALALLLEHHRGNPLPDILQQDILSPLGLSDTGMTRGDENVADMIHGYVVADGKELDVTQPKYMINFAGGGMFSTVSDVNAFYMALFQNRLLKPETVALMKDGGTYEYGLGLYLWDDSCTGGAYYGHGAGTAGYTGISMVSADGARQLTLLVANRPEDIRSDAGARYDVDRLADFARSTLNDLCPG